MSDTILHSLTYMYVAADPDVGDTDDSHLVAVGPRPEQV